MTLKWSSSLLLSLAFLLGCSSMDQEGTPYNPESPDSQATQIGLVFHFTGSAGQQPRFLENAVRMAVSEINAAGGVNGKPLGLMAKDDKLDPDFGEQAAQALVQDGVVAIMTATSGVTQRILSTVTDPALVPVVSPSATSPTLTGYAAHGTFFRTAPSDAFQGAILAQEVYSDAVRDVAVIHIDNAYGSGLTEVFKTQFEALGGTIRNVVSYPEGKTLDFSQQVTQLFSKGVPDGVLIVAYLVDGSNITRDLQVYDPQPRPQFYGTEGLYDSSFLLNGAADILNGFRGTTNAAPVDSATYQYFARQYLAGTGSEPILFSECGYDAVYLIALAMQQGGANTREAILANLRSVSNYSGAPARDLVVGPGEWAKAKAGLIAGQHVKYQGASGSIQWDANGDVTSGTYLVYRILDSNQGLHFETVRTVTFP